MNRHVRRLAALASCLLLAAGCSRQAAPLTRTEIDLLGTVCTVTLYEGGTEKTLEAVFSRLHQIEDRMTNNREQSEVSRVNQAAGSHPVPVSPDTFQVITEGLARSRTGGGLFDITVGPLVKLWGIGTEHARIPLEKEILAARSLIDYRMVALDESARTVFLQRPGMVLDLGGIAKGYASDEAARILRENGVRRALINLGGNVVTVGVKPGGARWRIGIQDPGKPRGEHLGVVTVGQTAVITSGVYERYFDENGVRYHHIMDPRTGYPARSGLLSVTVVTERGIMGDGSTSLSFILGLAEGRRYVESVPGMQGIFVTDAHEVFVTPGIKGSFQLTSPDYVLKGW
jgi:FAD:protein FMN transferase